MTWEDITIGRYFEIVNIVEKYKKASEYEQLPYVIDLVAACTGKSKEEYTAMPVSSLKSLVDSIGFISTPPKGRLSPKLVVNSKKYNVTINLKAITTAQYIDYTETLKNNPENIAMMCAIFCIPEGHKYNEGYEVVDLADEFYEHFKIVDAIGVSFFFTKLLKTYVKVTLNYLRRQLKREMKKAKKEKADPTKLRTILESIQALEHAGGLISSSNK